MNKISEEQCFPRVLDILSQSVVIYQSLALHERDLSPEVRYSHSNGFPIETIRGVPHESNPVSQHTDLCIVMKSRHLWILANVFCLTWHMSGM